MRSKRRQRLGAGIPALVALAALALLLSACGGSSDTSAVASIETTESTQTDTTESEEESEGSGSTDTQEVLLEYTQCLRDEGIDVEDPDFDGGGGGGPGGGGGGIFGDVDQDDPEFQAAQEVCSPILEGMQQQFDPDNQQEIQDAALEYAQCMRENGVDVEDPDFSNPGGGGGGQRGGGAFGDESDREDPDYEAANEKCQSAFEGIRGPGGAGGEDS